MRNSRPRTRSCDPDTDSGITNEGDKAGGQLTPGAASEGRKTASPQIVLTNEHKNEYDRV